MKHEEKWAATLKKHHLMIPTVVNKFYFTSLLMAIPKLGR